MQPWLVCERVNFRRRRNGIKNVLLFTFNSYFTLFIRSFIFFLLFVLFSIRSSLLVVGRDLNVIMETPQLINQRFLTVLLQLGALIYQSRTDSSDLPPQSSWKSDFEIGPVYRWRSLGTGSLCWLAFSMDRDTHRANGTDTRDNEDWMRGNAGII
jgi:hypothetical protein